MRFAIGLILTLLCSSYAMAQCCVLSDNGSGTANLPPFCGAGYHGTMSIVNGIPGGGTIECVSTLTPNSLLAVGVGGSLGGTYQTWDAWLQLQMSGTGWLAGFSRVINVPVTVTTETAPHPAGSVQVIGENIYDITGELFGDPDFCTFRVKAGTNYGMPSPGTTTLGASGPDWLVTSFFDIEYTIEFQGCPGSSLDGMGGTTQDQRLHELCPETVGNSLQSLGALKARFGN